LEASLDDCRSAGEPVTDSIANAYLAELELLTGDYIAARERLETLLAHASAAGGAIGVPIALVQLANLTLGCGDAAAARGLADPLVEAARAEGGIPFFLAAALSVQGAACLATGDTATARALEESFELGSGTENPG
jgi:ATP/maltotriose-dependent transcriptional regulator MalT